MRTKIDFSELPLEVTQYVVNLRKEAADYRNQRNGARREAEQLRADLDALKGVQMTGRHKVEHRVRIGANDDGTRF